MQKALRKIVYAIISAILVAGLFACSSFPSYGYIRSLQADEYFNAPSELLYYYDSGESGAKERAQSTLKQINDSIACIEYNLSAEKEGGDIYRFNHASAGEEVVVSKETYEVFLNARSIWEKTEGAYNPAVRLLVDLWGFSPRFNDGAEVVTQYDRESASTPPEQKYIDLFKTLTNFGDIEATETDGVYTLKKPSNTAANDGVTYSMQLDFGGYGKGYAAKRSAEMITGAGFNLGYVSFGSSSLHLLSRPQTGKGDKSEWQLKLTYPSSTGANSGDWYVSLYAENSGVATSGDYERFYEKDGIIYSHIIDASTGKPIGNGICTATIIGKDAAAADALTTAILVMGKDRAIEFINRYLTDCKVVFAVRDGGVLGIYTNQPESSIALNPAHNNLKVLAYGDGNGRIKVNANEN